MTTRFDLEQAIMRVWGITEDLNTVYQQYDHQQLTQDDVQNVLLGLITLYNMKFEQLFALFEQLIKEKKL